MSKLIGTEPNQVPSNADLGTAAYKEAKDFLLAKGSSLSRIDTILNRTLYSGTIYDTSQDSDGGAWRHRCSHTSWYNEPLNTATRGSRREFPSVAIIVQDSADTYIYDADDPDLPMWMKFDSTYQAMLYGNATGIKCINGAMFSSQAESTSGTWIIPLTEVNFIKDKAFGYAGGGNNNAATYGTFEGNISERNVQKTYDGRNLLLFVRKSGNSLDVRILPNAPIDPETKLPKPSVVLGCGEISSSNGGVSVAVHMETVTNLVGSDQGTTKPVDSVSWVGDDKVMYCHNYGCEINTISWSRDYSSTYYNGIQTWVGRISNGDSHSGFGTLDHIADSNASLKAEALDEKTATVWSSDGLSIAKDFAYEDDNNGRIAHITTSYNTGYMPQGIRIATLCEASNTDVLIGEEIVTNGTFDTDLSSWTAGSSDTIELNANRLRLIGGDTVGTAVQTVYLQAGTTYRLSANITFGSAFSAVLQINNGSTTTSVASTSRTGNGNGLYSGRYTATVTGAHTLILYHSVSSGSGFDVYFDNVSLKEVMPNRAAEDGEIGARVFRQRDLVPYGRIPVSEVAPGSEVVAYGPFETNYDYFEMPWSEHIELASGSDSFCAMFWLNYDASVGTYNYIWEKAQPGVALNYTECRINNSSQRIEMYINGSSNGIAHANIHPNMWHFVCHGRHNGHTYMYVDGKLGGYDIPGKMGYDIGSFYNTNSIFRVGQRAYDSTTGAPGLKLSLFRWSAKFFPSRETINDIYQQEKTFFTKDAKSTLYGTSDDVNWASFDKQTGRLYAGTSNGISTFEGLRRVDNTTEEVSHFTAAANGLVIGD